MAEPGEGTGARTKLLQQVAAQMDAIEADFGDAFEIVSAVTVVVVKRPDDELGIRVRNVDMSPLEAVGVLSVAQDILKSQAG
jgi:hypothetical protein